MKSEKRDANTFCCRAKKNRWDYFTIVRATARVVCVWHV